jgi:hypothetical protein
MDMAEEAFRGLWPEKELDYDFSIKYSGKFRGYNANVRMLRSKIMFSLSRNWRPISRDIKIGLLQELLARLFKEKRTTSSIDLYHIFLKKVHIAIPKTASHPFLEESFERVNDRLFAGMMEKPNLRWSDSTRKLGSYDYGSDTITISTMLENTAEDTDLIDYVMYHELLHKKYKFSSKNGRMAYHTKEFRKSEKAFPDSAEIEKRLRMLRPRRKAVKKRKPSFLRFLGFS